MRRFLYVIVFLFLSVALFADGVTFTGKAPARVGVGQRMQVQYTLNEKPSSIQLGNISGFKCVGGPSQSSSSSVSIVNGSMTSSNTYTYTYTLEAVSEGTYTLEGAVAVVGGTKYTSNSISVTVQKEAVQQQQRQSSYYDPFEDIFGSGNSRQQQQQQQQNQPKQTVASDDVLLRIFSSKSSLAKGEGTIITIKLYTAIDLVSIEDFNPPKLNNFYMEELETDQNLRWTRETLNGKTYNVAVLKKYLAFPRVAGKVDIDKAEIKCMARVVSGRHPFWGYTYDNAPVSASSNALSLNVASLPQEPVGYSGAVGKFNISLNMPTDTVSVNDAVLCKITISGSGNFNNIESPKISCPKEFEQYEPVVTSKLNASESGLSGSKTWEYTIVPRYGGSFNLGAVSLVYYDLATKTYNTISTEPIIVNVRKGSGDASASTIYNSQTGVEVINPEDVRFIHKGDLNLVAAYSPLMLSGLYWLIILAILLIFIVLVVVLRKNIKKRQDVELMKRQKASKISRKRLKNARKYMQTNNQTDFYKKIITALWGYASDKLSIPTSQLTKDNVMQAFAEHNIDEALSKQFVDLIDKCEFAHFVSGSGNEMSAIYEETTGIIEQLEENMR
ncbi:MAG: protein BatD [Bacteroidales bacterium]|nr:protein BatD [Bacteroidales bacterium]